MQDGPSALDIIDAVIERLSTVVAPTLSGRMKFEVRVAERALQLARRDLALASNTDGLELDRLGALVGDVSHDLEQANHRLCSAIAVGEVELHSPELLAHLRATTLEKLAVDQPDYPPLTASKA